MHGPTAIPYQGKDMASKSTGWSRLFSRIGFLLVLPSLLLVSSALGQVDPGLLAGMAARSIGPAGMSGRVADVVAAPSDPTIVYVGAATGGVWKSVNGGLSFEAVFDDQPVAAVGAIAIHPTDPDVVWVGTGEGNVRNSVSVGNGIYRTRDGGRTWEHMGLESSERIHRIIIHPTDPNTLWVAAMGRQWGENEERGVYRTTNAGRTWERVLYVNERTGAADLIIDPGNPDKLFAAMWEYRRWPWFFRSGGSGSGLLSAGCAPAWPSDSSSAAAVTSRPVFSSPAATARSLSPVRSCSSFMRESRNTS